MNCCKRCGSTALTESIGTWGPHTVRQDCTDCGAFVKWGKDGPSLKERMIQFVKNEAAKGNQDAIVLAKDIRC